jgi:hypothetical protein
MKDATDFSGVEGQATRFEPAARLAHRDDNPYEFIFSRLRKPANMQVPFRVRAASNPLERGIPAVRAFVVVSRQALYICQSLVRDWNPNPRLTR